MTTQSRLFGILFMFASASAAFGASALRETANGPDTADSVLNVGGAILSSGGSALPGADVGISVRIADRSPLYAGAELGTFFSLGNASYGVFPILGSLYYQFEPVSALHPLLGAMAGPVFSTGGGVSAGRLAVLFRPGFNIELGRRAAINIEPRFGVIGSSFVFIPQAGAIFAI